MLHVGGVLASRKKACTRLSCQVRIKGLMGFMNLIYMIQSSAVSAVSQSSASCTRRITKVRPTNVQPYSSKVRLSIVSPQESSAVASAMQQLQERVRRLQSALAQQREGREAQQLKRKSAEEQLGKMREQQESFMAENLWLKSQLKQLKVNVLNLDQQLIHCKLQAQHLQSSLALQQSHLCPSSTCNNCLALKTRVESQQRLANDRAAEVFMLRRGISHFMEDWQLCKNFEKIKK